MIEYEWDEPGERTPIPEAPSQSASLYQRLAVVHLCLAGVMLYAGGLALHIWTTYLFFDRWGIVWAVVAFSLPPLAEIVAAVACFWWGAWFYILAVLAWLTGLASFAVIQYAEEQPSRLARWLSAAAAISMYILVGAFSYFTVHDATMAKPVTEEQKEELEDVTCAVCAILIDSSSADSTVLTNLVDAKQRLRRRIQKYDPARKLHITQGVNAYLRARVLVECDFKACLQQAQVQEKPFSLSPETRHALRSLPTRLRSDTENEIEVIENLLRKVQTRPRDEGAQEILGIGIDREWRLMRGVYEDLLGTAMPSREELLTQSL